MSKSSWAIWGVVLTFWGLYSCWHFGYQAGYADGHQTAWRLSQPYPMMQAAANSESEQSDSETLR